MRPPEGTLNLSPSSSSFQRPKFLAGWRYAASACEEPALSIALRYKSSKESCSFAVLFVLLTQAQDFSENFHIKALTLSLGKDFLLALIQSLDRRRQLE